MRRLATGIVVALVATVVASSAAQTVRYVDTLAVYDSVGRKVGDVDWQGEFTLAEVLFRTGSGKTFAIPVYAGSWGTDGLAYASEDCTGAAHIAVRDGVSPIVGPWVAVAGPRATLYVPGGAFTLQTMTSWRRPDGTCVVDGQWRPYAPAVAELDLADYFVPPFVIRARGGVVPE